MPKKIIELVTGMLLVLVMGVFWGTWFSLSRTMNGLSPEIFITIGKEIMQNVAVTMRVIMPASIVGLAILLVWSWKTKSVYFYCLAVALVLFIIALIITLTVEVPIDNQIRTWTATTIPAGWENIRDRWERYHTMRTFASLACILFFLAGLISKTSLQKAYA